MTCLHSFALIAATVTSIFVSVPVQAATVLPANMETKIAIVFADTTEGNYLEFQDGTGGWWLEADEEHPTFEVGQIFKCTIDNLGTEEIEDDELLALETLGFIELPNINTQSKLLQ